MKKRILIVYLILQFLLINVSSVFAYSDTDSLEKQLTDSLDNFKSIYMEAELSGDKEIPCREWYEETVKMHEEAIDNPGVQIYPSKRWVQEVEKRYESDIKKVEEQINSTPAEHYTKSATDVYTGTNYTFNTANCGAHGEYGDCDEDKGNFEHGWGSTSGGYADALSQYTLAHLNTATTWAWVGKEIKVHGTRNARITYDGKWQYYLMGWTTPCLARGTIKVSVYNATNSIEVANKTIEIGSNYYALPTIDSDDFTDTIDVQLVDGKTYYLKMQVWAYAGAGFKANADLISSSDVPARGGDGVDYHSIGISWL